MGTDNSSHWQATLTPHRSLTPNGFLTVIGIVAAANFAVGVMFVTIGAWPVTGFAALDVLLLWWAFRKNFADARRAERISITEHDVVLEWFHENEPKNKLRLVRRWVRVNLEEDQERELIGRLSLLSGGSKVYIGDFLAPEERRSLAQALRAALAVPNI